MVYGNSNSIKSKAKHLYVHTYLVLRKNFNYKKMGQVDLIASSSCRILKNKITAREIKSFSGTEY